MVGVPHGTSWVGVDPPSLRSVGTKGTRKWAPEGEWLNHYNSAADCPILLKFCAMTHTKAPEGWRLSKLELEIEFRHHGAFFQIRFWVHTIAPINISSPNLVCVENGLPQRVEWSTHAHLEYPKWWTDMYIFICQLLNIVIV